MRVFSKCTARLCLVTIISIIAGTLSSSAQQSSSLAPLSSGVPQLGKYTAASKGNQLVFDHSTVRLIAGDARSKTRTVGVEIILAPGWKTYWRVPGDAGVPAEFIWENSTNMKSAKVSWPAPKRYEDITGKSIGYKKHVIFPVTITPENTDKPVNLDLRLYYAVCSDICVPAQANLKLDLPVQMQNSLSAQRIRRFAATVPNKQAKDVAVAKTTAVMINGKPVLSVKLLGNIAPQTDVLVEGFKAAFFEAPKLVAKEKDGQVFHLNVDGIDNIAEMSGKTLKLTILSGDARFEKSVKLE